MFNTLDGTDSVYYDRINISSGVSGVYAPQVSGEQNTNPRDFDGTREDVPGTQISVDCVIWWYHHEY